MLDEAEALIEGMSLAVSQPALHAETDLRVHRALASVCPNEFLRDAVLDLIDAAASPVLASTRHQAWAGGELPSVWENQQHHVLAAIRAGDADGAMQAAWSHLASAAENALSFLGEEPSIPEASRDRLLSMLEKGPMSHPPAQPLKSGGGGRARGRAPVAKSTGPRTGKSPHRPSHSEG